ncbi:MAG: hypothetical protein IBX61_09895, partial [Thermoleophilia bacterium]|nr:hypothetical protein [Thermoleophilia bacterium]
RRIPSYEKRALAANLIREHYRAAAWQAQYEFITKRFPDVYQKVYGEDQDPPPEFDKRAALYTRAFILDLQGGDKWRHVHLRSEDFIRTLRRYEKKAGIRYGCQERELASRLEWAKRIREQENIRSPGALLKGATGELKRFLDSRRQISLEWEWALYEELLIQASYLYRWEKDLKRGKPTNREFEALIPPRRICKNCGLVFSQGPSDNFTFYCKRTICRRDRDRKRQIKSRETKKSMEWVS